jgi:uncharacterized protein
VAGCQRIMHRIGMLDVEPPPPPAPPTVSYASLWLRAPEGGIFRSHSRIGDWAKPGDVIGVISDPFGELEVPVRTAESGIIIGQSRLPVVNRGDALFHLARAEHLGAAATIEAAQYVPLPDEDEII